jgi:hypothetical protein
MPAFFTQKVNQYLCIALISLMTFWVVLYYFTVKAEIIGENIIASNIIHNEAK